MKKSLLPIIGGVLSALFILGAGQAQAATRLRVVSGGGCTLISAEVPLLNESTNTDNGFITGVKLHYEAYNLAHQKVAWGWMSGSFTFTKNQTRLIALPAPPVTYTPNWVRFYYSHPGGSGWTNWAYTAKCEYLPTGPYQAY